MKKFIYLVAIFAFVTLNSIAANSLYFEDDVVVSISQNDLIIISSFIFIFVGFIFSRQYLTPLINKAKDEINKSDNLSKVKFNRLHRFSVLINILQIVICIIILCYIIIF